VVHDVAAGDTLGKIAKKYGETMDLIKASNGMKSDTVRIGQRLRIWTGKFSVHVDKSQNVLLLKSGDEVLKVYHVSTGTNNSTPAGTFKITTKLENPVWFKADAIIPPESPKNVLGSRWMGFDIEGYGIHGTVDPDKIGQQVTAGCVRMRNEDVEELYRIIPLGTEVTIAD
jgi:lipoprotein-anchoring transpeptidase ErfK/SrfK